VTEDVVITGVGCLTARVPDARGLLAAGRPTTAAPGRLPDPLPRPATWACRPPRLGRLDRFSQIALLAAHEAFAAAGLAAPPPGDAGGAPPPGDAWGVVLGTAYGCHAMNEQFYRGLMASGVRGASPRAFAATLPSTPAAEIAILLGARGPALTLAHGWDAGLGAVAEAARLLAAGRAEVLLAGGADQLTDTLAGLLDSWGYAAGASEGAGFLVLERAAAARRRGAPAVARVCGAAAAFAPSPGHRTAALRAARGALREAGVESAAVVGVITALAPGDDLGDLGPGLAHPVDVAAHLGVTFAAGGPLGVARAALGPPAGPTLVVASDPLGSATALVLDAAAYSSSSPCSGWAAGGGAAAGGGSAGGSAGASAGAAAPGATGTRYCSQTR
jgi:3-oxoacyl-[acyl-carrier-protein] synthase II